MITVLPCTACGAPAVLTITLRGCTHLRCQSCGDALLKRLPTLREHARDPGDDPVVERLQVVANVVASAAA